MSSSATSEGRDASQPISAAQRLEDREWRWVSGVLLAAAMCFVVFDRRILPRTIQGEELTIRLGLAGLMLGLGAGNFRLRRLRQLLCRLGDESPSPRRPSLKVDRKVGVLFVFAHMMTASVCTVTAGAQVNRLIKVGDTKTDLSLIIGMHGGAKALCVRLRLRDREEKFPVSLEYFGRLSILDVVEVRSQPGMLGYDFVIDIVKVGSKRIAN